MQIAGHGAIKKILLPGEFSEGKTTYGGTGQNWSFDYYAKNNPEVTITFYYRGTSIHDDDALFFLRLLEKEPQQIFSADKNSHESVEQLIHGLAPALGNAGNNQITNKNTGMRGPRFFLASLQTMEINNKRALLVAGYFHTFEGSFSQAFRGLFFPAKNTPDSCDIEELFLQTPSKESMEEYASKFAQALASIEWA